MVTNALLSAAISALSLVYKGEVRSAYVSRGRVSEDRPVQMNYLALAEQIGDYGQIGVWHWDYHSLTPRRREVAERQFRESDYAVFGVVPIHLTKGWTLQSRPELRWFTFPFNHDAYSGKGDRLMTEWYFKQTLENPYVTPLWFLRRGIHPTDTTYFRLGLQKPCPLDAILPWEGFTIQPGVYTDLGNDAIRSEKYGAERPDGGRWGSGVMSASVDFRISYEVNTWLSVFTRVEQFGIVDSDAREATHSPRHRDLTMLDIGLIAKF